MKAERRMQLNEAARRKQLSKSSTMNAAQVNKSRHDKRSSSQ
jgi:hypothetical protein